MNNSKEKASVMNAGFLFYANITLKELFMLLFPQQAPRDLFQSPSHLFLQKEIGCRLPDSLTK